MNTTNLTLFFIIILSGSLIFLSCHQSQHPQKGVFNIIDFGAIGDGMTLNTRAIQQAINSAESAGGGRVIIPPGIYKSGTIFLKNNIILDVQPGATILGSENINDYTEMTWGHNRDRQPYHLIMAKDVQNITISGGGTIDGNGPAFWQPHNPKDDPQWIMPKAKKISPLMEIQNCQNVRIQDVLLKTGGGWTLHLYDSDLIHVNRVQILNHLFSPNGDGIDITGCFDVTISDCIIKTCDDAICLKTTGDSRECKRVTVTNCIIECSCAALKLGNESFRDISQVTLSNCTIFNSSRAFAIYAESAGTIEDIAVSNIVCDTRSPLIYNRPIHISLRKRFSENGLLYDSQIINSDKIFDPAGREPQLRNIMISNFIAKTEGRILITAAPGQMIENLTLRDIHLTYPFIEDPVPYIDRAKSSQFSPQNPAAKQARAAVVVENVKNFVLENLNITWPMSSAVPKDWQFPKRIANGTIDSFYPDYFKARQTEFSAVWARNIQGGYIHSPLAKASNTTHATFDIQNSSLPIIRY